MTRKKNTNQGTINEPIQIMIDQSINEIPRPQKITITAIYDDNKHVDAKSDNDETFEYIRAIGSNINENQIGVLLFLENNEMIILT